MKNATKQIIGLFVLSFLQISNTQAKTFIIKMDKTKINLPSSPQPQCSNLSNLTLISTKNYTYNGSYGYDGSVQIANIPLNTTCIKAVVSGGGGAYWGGSTDQTIHGGYGDLVQGTIKYSDLSGNLNIIVAGIAKGGNPRSNAADAGGLSGVFDGIPSKSSALIVAGGGSSSTQINGNNGSFNTTKPPSNDTGQSGGFGFGGSGLSSVYGLPQAQPFGNGATAGNGYTLYAHGGYGGGGSDSGNGAGGGGGFPGGSGTCCSSAYSAEAGTSYCNSNILNCNSIGNGGTGGTYNNTDGGKGQVTLYFYK